MATGALYREFTSTEQIDAEYKPSLRVARLRMLGRSRRATGAPDVRAVKTASATATAALTMKARRQWIVASSPPISGDAP